MTNADKVRQMTDEELWYWLDDLGNVCMCWYYSVDRARCDNYKSCRDCWLDWLAEEADRADGSDGADESKKQGNGK